ncbi:MAG: PA4642 family protein [Gammaproteobacteria bacterium]|nr:PA4642 family protein [Gammaproteobacteria bacterium]
MKTAPKARPDKQKVIDEVWTDGRVKEFLNTITPSQAGEEFSGDHDFYVLLRAYHAMRLEDFEKFLEYFREEGGDLQATNGRDQTVRTFISTHRKAGPFIAAIDAALTSGP